MKARRWRRDALLGLVTAVALVTAGCGGDQGSGARAGGGETPRLEGLVKYFADQAAVPQILS